MWVVVAAGAVSRQGSLWACEQGGGWWETSLVMVERSLQGPWEHGARPA